MKRRIIGIFVMTLLIATALPVVGTYNIDMTDIENNDRACIESVDIGFIFAIGDFTETETQYSGHYSYYLFIGMINGEFCFFQGQDEYLMLQKDSIVKGYILTSKIILARIIPIM